MDISPFPTDIDREAFAWAVTGFTAGEGCFTLGITNNTREGSRPTGCAKFTIKLRADDSKTIRLIRSFFQCGLIYERHKVKRGNPAIQFDCVHSRHLATIVIPHFERYPLSILDSKKHEDFLIFKEAVALLRRIARKSKPTRGWHNGCQPRWTDDDLKAFQDFKSRIAASHAYKTPNQMPGQISDRCLDRSTLVQHDLFGSD